jgi:hypothetical protein
MARYTERTAGGYFILSTIRKGQFVEMKYMYYTKSEARKLFAEHLKSL